MCVAPLFLAVVGAVLQFDSRGTNCEDSFPALLHQDDFEVYLLIEYVGAVLAGGFMVREYLFTDIIVMIIVTTDSGWLWYYGPS